MLWTELVELLLPDKKVICCKSPDTAAPFIFTTGPLITTGHFLHNLNQACSRVYRNYYKGIKEK